jgi:hypothetical protein
MQERKPYPSDVSDEEWTFVAPYLTLTDRRDGSHLKFAQPLVHNTLPPVGDDG